MEDNPVISVKLTFFTEYPSNWLYTNACIWSDDKTFFFVLMKKKKITIIMEMIGLQKHIEHVAVISTPNIVFCNWLLSQFLSKCILTVSNKFDCCNIFSAVLFVQKDKQLVQKQNKPTTKLSDAEDAVFIRLVLIHLHMIPALSAIHPSLSSLYIMYLNRKEMEVTESVVTMIKYHSWRLTGHQGPLTDTIHREWREGERGCL